MAENNERVFESMKVKELREYLGKHRQLTSGKKEELVRRAKGTFQLLLQKNTDDLCTGESATDKHTSALADNPHLENQTVASLQGWIEVDKVTVDDWPDVTDKELYNYLVYTCHKTVDLKSTQARRQLKAHTFYEDRHVHSISYHPVTKDSEQCYIKCLVIPSAASTDKSKYPDKSVWICLSKVTGQARSAYCTCTAGLEGSCNHVAALLYALVDITLFKQKGLDSSTSSACKWKQPRKRRLSPKKATDFCVKSGDPEQAVHSGVNITSFAKRMHQCNPDCGWLINYSAPEISFPAKTNNHKKLPPIPEPNYRFADWVDIKSSKCQQVFKEFVANQSVTASEKVLIEELTRDQNTKGSWMDMRKGKLTSSKFGEIYKQKQSTKPDSLLKSVMQYYEDGTRQENEHMKWGRTHEPAARRCYHNIMSKSHPGIEVKKSGLHLYNDAPYLAASPDGIVTCPHCNEDKREGLLEVKCPSVYRNKTPEEACLQDNFFCRVVNGQVTLKREHNYYFQVQGQMAVTGRKWCDFFVWTLKGQSVECIHFDEDLWSKVISKLTYFYVTAVVPELFTERVKRGLALS